MVDTIGLAWEVRCAEESRKRRQEQGNNYTCQWLCSRMQNRISTYKPSTKLQVALNCILQLLNASLSSQTLQKPLNSVHDAVWWRSYTSLIPRLHPLDRIHDLWTTRRSRRRPGTTLMSFLHKFIDWEIYDLVHVHNLQCTMQLFKRELIWHTLDEILMPWCCSVSCDGCTRNKVIVW